MVVNGEVDALDTNEGREHMVWECCDTDEEEGCGTQLESALRALGQGKSQFWRSRIIAHSSKSWETFYKLHGEGFFLPRTYLDRDFPCLQLALHQPFSLLEFGCGTGASLLPLLSRLPLLQTTGFDLSPHAIALARAHSTFRENSHRACFFAGDATADISVSAQVARAHEEWRAERGWCPLHIDNRQGFHSVLLLFCLSAIAPELHGKTMTRAAECLRPGGLLLFRDYGEGDEAQARFGKGAKLDDDGAVMVRRDGTLAVFMKLRDLRKHCADAGLVDVTSEYLKRKYQNRATGQTLRRKFIHAIFRKPWGLM